MKIDLSQPAPRVRPLEEAQALIDEMWLLLQALSERNEEQAQLIQRQGAIIEAQARRIETLEEQLRTNSRNSSRPPSADQRRHSHTKTSPGDRKPGGQPGHSGKARGLLPPEQVTQTHDCHPDRCPACGSTVRIVGLCARHQVIDLPPIQPVVTEYRLYAGVCRYCGQHCEASLPPGVGARVTGPRLLALIGALTGGYRLSKRLTQGLLADLFGIDLSVGAISQAEAELSAALAPIVHEAHAHVQQAPVVHADETGHKQRGMRQWMWLVVAGAVAVFLARASRSAQAARDALGADFAGLLVSDRYTAYAWVDARRRQLCWAHLLRDFMKMSERSGVSGRIGDELLALAKRMFGFWYRVRDGTLSRAMFAIHMLFLRAQIEAVLQRGADCRHAETARTCRHILRLRQALWTFIDTPGVEPTNNLAERTLRSYVIWRKVGFGAQSARGSRYLERIMTVVGSCRLQGRNLLGFLTQAVQAYWGSGSLPSLVRVDAVAG
jgi:transposase